MHASSALPTDLCRMGDDHLCYYDMFMDSLLARSLALSFVQGEREERRARRERRIPEKRACKIEEEKKRKKMADRDRGERRNGRENQGGEQTRPP